MPFTARDLRYQPEQSYPMLYAYLHRNAQRYLGAFKYDAFEVDTVIGHVVEQLVRLGLFGGASRTPLSALDGLSDAQFYAFLTHSVRNKAIDRLRKRRLPVSNAADLEIADSTNDGDPLDNVVESIWGAAPFATPEESTLHIASQKELRNVLKHCIMMLGAAPHQLQAVLQEMQACGADELLQTVIDELHLSLPATLTPEQHMNQHKDHAHKKLRSCLQQQSTNLTVRVALRLTLYKPTANEGDYAVDIESLVQDDLAEDEVRIGLHELVDQGWLSWYGEDELHLTTTQIKRLARFYKEE